MASEVVPAVGPDYGRSLFLRGQRVPPQGRVTSRARAITFGPLLPLIMPRFDSRCTTPTNADGARIREGS